MYIIFTVPIKKIVTTIDKNGEEITKKYLLHFTVHYQILLIIYVKDFTESNVNQNMMMKNVKHVELNISITIAF